MSLDITLTMHYAGNQSCEVYEANITHNLGPMARAAGIYDCVWRPEEHGIIYARQLIDPLFNALKQMKSDPDSFKKHDSPNGWGLYENFVPWLDRYLDACMKYPDAKVQAFR